MDNPKKPWKAVAGGVVVFLSTLILQPNIEFDPWVEAVIISGIAAATVYGIRNPKATV